MGMLLWLTLLPLCLAFYRVVIYHALVSPLARIPAAHWSAHFSPVWILMIRYYGRENREVHAAHCRSGAVVRLGPNEISVNSLECVKSVYVGGWEKSAWYSVFTNYWGVRNMFTMLDNRSHSHRKRQLSNIYAKSFLQTTPAFSLLVREVIKSRFLGRLKAVAEQDGSVIVLELLNCLTMDAMSAYIFGLPSGTQFLHDEKGYREFYSSYTERGKHSFAPQEMPSLLRVMKMFNFPVCGTKEKKAREEVDKFCLELCNKASRRIELGQEQEHNHEAVVFKQLRRKADQDRGDTRRDFGSKMVDKVIASEMLDHLLAGHETTAIALTYAMYRLSLNQVVQAELRKELQSLPQPFLESEASPIPPTKDIDALPVLHAVMIETLRLNAPIPGAQPRLSPKDAFLEGYGPLPLGTRVSAQAYSMHRNEKVFPEPSIWSPYRWLQKDGPQWKLSEDKEMARWFWAFSSGGRMCIGSNFANLEMKMVLAAVYTNFRTKIVDGSGIEQEDGYTVGPKGPVTLSFQSI